MGPDFSLFRGESRACLTQKSGESGPSRLLRSRSALNPTGAWLAQSAEKCKDKSPRQPSQSLRPRIPTPLSRSKTCGAFRCADFSFSFFWWFCGCARTALDKKRPGAWPGRRGLRSRSRGPVYVRIVIVCACPHRRRMRRVRLRGCSPRVALPDRPSSSDKAWRSGTRCRPHRRRSRSGGSAQGRPRRRRR